MKCKCTPSLSCFCYAFNVLFSRHACGENSDRVYGQTRMDGQGNFRQVWKIRDAHEAFVQGL